MVLCRKREYRFSDVKASGSASKPRSLNLEDGGSLNISVVTKSKIKDWISNDITLAAWNDEESY